MSRQPPDKTPVIEGLIYLPVDGRDHNFFFVLATSTGQEEAVLREIVAQSIEAQIVSMTPLYQGRAGAACEELRNYKRLGIASDSYMIEASMAALGRPIALINSAGKIIADSRLERFSGEPIFLYCNGTDYDVYALAPDSAPEQSRLILNRLIAEQGADLAAKASEPNMASRSASQAAPRPLARKPGSQIPGAAPRIEGLNYQPVPGDGHCLYYAVSLYLGLDQQNLRELVVEHIELNLEIYLQQIERLFPERTAQEYLRDVLHGVEWADHFEIEILMNALDQPIVIIESTGRIRAGLDLDRFTGSPIFIYYNGRDHYDSYLLAEAWGERAREILLGLTQNTAAPAVARLASPSDSDAVSMRSFIIDVNALRRNRVPHQAPRNRVPRFRPGSLGVGAGAGVAASAASAAVVAAPAEVSVNIVHHGHGINISRSAVPPSSAALLTRQIATRALIPVASRSAIPPSSMSLAVDNNIDNLVGRVAYLQRGDFRERLAENPALAANSVSAVLVTALGAVLFFTNARRGMADGFENWYKEQYYYDPDSGSYDASITVAADTVSIGVCLVICLSLFLILKGRLRSLCEMHPLDPNRFNQPLALLRLLDRASTPPVSNDVAAAAVIKDIFTNLTAEKADQHKEFYLQLLEQLRSSKVLKESLDRRGKLLLHAPGPREESVDRLLIKLYFPQSVMQYFRGTLDQRWDVMWWLIRVIYVYGIVPARSRPQLSPPPMPSPDLARFSQLPSRADAAELAIEVGPLNRVATAALGAEIRPRRANAIAVDLRSLQATDSAASSSSETRATHAPAPSRSASAAGTVLVLGARLPELAALGVGMAEMEASLSSLGSALNGDEIRINVGPSMSASTSALSAAGGVAAPRPRAGSRATEATRGAAGAGSGGVSGEGVIAGRGDTKWHQFMHSLVDKAEMSYEKLIVLLEKISGGREDDLNHVFAKKINEDARLRADLRTLGDGLKKTKLHLEISNFYVEDRNAINLAYQSLMRGRPLEPYETLTDVVAEHSKQIDTLDEKIKELRTDLEGYQRVITALSDRLGLELDELRPRVTRLERHALSVNAAIVGLATNMRGFLTSYRQDLAQIEGVINALRARLIENETRAADQIAAVQAEIQALTDRLEQQRNFADLIPIFQSLIEQVNAGFGLSGEYDTHLKEVIEALVRQINEKFNSGFEVSADNLGRLHECVLACVHSVNAMNRRIRELERSAAEAASLPPNPGPTSPIPVPAEYDSWLCYLVERARSEFDRIPGQRKAQVYQKIRVFNHLWNEALFKTNDLEGHDRRMLLIGFFTYWSWRDHRIVFDTASDSINFANTNLTEDERRYIQGRRDDIEMLRVMNTQQVSEMMFYLLSGEGFHRNVAFEILGYCTLSIKERAELFATLVKLGVEENILKPHFDKLMVAAALPPPPPSRLKRGLDLIVGVATPVPAACNPPEALIRILSLFEGQVEIQPYLLRLFLTNVVATPADQKLAQAAIWHPQFDQQRPALFNAIFASTEEKVLTTATDEQKRAENKRACKSAKLAKAALWPLGSEGLDSDRACYFIDYLQNKHRPRQVGVVRANYFKEFAELLLSECSDRDERRIAQATALLKPIMAALNQQGCLTILWNLTDSREFTAEIRRQAVAVWFDAVVDIFNPANKADYLSDKTKEDIAKALNLVSCLGTTIMDRIRRGWSKCLMLDAPGAQLAHVIEALAKQSKTDELVRLTLSSYLMKLDSVSDIDRRNIFRASRNLLITHLNNSKDLPVAALINYATLLGADELAPLWKQILQEMAPIAYRHGQASALTRNNWQELVRLTHNAYSQTPSAPLNSAERRLATTRRSLSFALIYAQYRSVYFAGRAPGEQQRRECGAKIRQILIAAAYLMPVNEAVLQRQLSALFVQRNPMAEAIDACGLQAESENLKQAALYGLGPALAQEVVPADAPHGGPQPPSVRSTRPAAAARAQAARNAARARARGGATIRTALLEGVSEEASLSSDEEDSRASSVMPGRPERASTSSSSSSSPSEEETSYPPALRRQGLAGFQAGSPLLVASPAIDHRSVQVSLVAEDDKAAATPAVARALTVDDLLLQGTPFSPGRTSVLHPPRLILSDTRGSIQASGKSAGRAAASPAPAMDLATAAARSAARKPDSIAAKAARARPLHLPAVPPPAFSAAAASSSESAAASAPAVPTVAPALGTLVTAASAQQKASRGRQRAVVTKANQQAPTVVKKNPFNRYSVRDPGIMAALLRGMAAAKDAQDREAQAKIQASAQAKSAPEPAPAAPVLAAVSAPLLLAVSPVPARAQVKSTSEAAPAASVLAAVSAQAQAQAALVNKQRELARKTREAILTKGLAKVEARKQAKAALVAGAAAATAAAPPPFPFAAPVLVPIQAQIQASDQASAAALSTPPTFPSEGLIAQQRRAQAELAERQRQAARERDSGIASGLGKLVAKREADAALVAEAIAATRSPTPAASAQARSGSEAATAAVPAPVSLAAPAPVSATAAASGPTQSQAWPESEAVSAAVPARVSLAAPASAPAARQLTARQKAAETSKRYLGTFLAKAHSSQADVNVPLSARNLVGGTTEGPVLAQASAVSARATQSSLSHSTVRHQAGGVAAHLAPGSRAQAKSTLPILNPLLPTATAALAPVAARAQTLAYVEGRQAREVSADELLSDNSSPRLGVVAKRASRMPARRRSNSAEPAVERVVTSPLALAAATAPLPGAPAAEAIEASAASVNPLQKPAIRSSISPAPAPMVARAGNAMRGSIVHPNPAAGVGALMKESGSRAALGLGQSAVATPSERTSLLSAAVAPGGVASPGRMAGRVRVTVVPTAQVTTNLLPAVDRTAASLPAHQTAAAVAGSSSWFGAMANAAVNRVATALGLAQSPPPQRRVEVHPVATVIPSALRRRRSKSESDERPVVIAATARSGAKAVNRDRVAVHVARPEGMGLMRSPALASPLRPSAGSVGTVETLNALAELGRRDVRVSHLSRVSVASAASAGGAAAGRRLENPALGQGSSAAALRPTLPQVAARSGSVNPMAGLVPWSPSVDPRGAAVAEEEESDHESSPPQPGSRAEQRSMAARRYQAASAASAAAPAPESEAVEVVAARDGIPSMGDLWVPGGSERQITASPPARPTSVRFEAAAEEGEPVADRRSRRVSLPAAGNNRLGFASQRSSRALTIGSPEQLAAAVAALAEGDDEETATAASSPRS